MASSSEQTARAAVRGFLPPQNDAEQLVMRRAQDLYSGAQKHWTAKWSGFLSDREQALCAAALNRSGCEWYRFEGGYPGAERKLLGVVPPGEAEEAPLGFWQIDCSWDKGMDPPSHKDYLGALTGLLIGREVFGDILTDDAHPGRAYLVALQSAAPLLRELSGVGRASARAVSCEQSALLLAAQKPRQLRSATVASLRLDAVLAAMLNCSRGIAAELIRAKKVELNHVAVQNAHSEVYEGDLFTVRGRGRFRLEALGGRSRKDRLFIQFFQY